MKSEKSMLRSVVLILMMLGLAWTAAASDAIESGVTPVGAPTPIVIAHGAGLTPGTYAIGTIHVLYTVNAYQFTAGTFAQFQLNLRDVANTASHGAQTSFPVNFLELYQVGSPNLVLTPSPASFSVPNTGWTGSSLVTITIPSSVLSDPSLNEDGAELVGVLQMSAPGGAHLDTPTTVLVKIKLVHPSSCLRVYHFITSQEYVPVSSATVRVKNGSVISSSPGQFSDNTLVVNTCAGPQSFDLKITLDPAFRTNPVGNPGNAVFIYFTTGQVDASTFVSAFGLPGGGDPQGQALLLSNITLPAGQTFLATVHMTVRDDYNSSLLPADGTFDFSVALCSVGTSLLHPLATPNPAPASQAFTIQTPGR